MSVKIFIFVLFWAFFVMASDVKAQGISQAADDVKSSAVAEDVVDPNTLNDVEYPE